MMCTFYEHVDKVQWWIYYGSFKKVMSRRDVLRLPTMVCDMDVIRKQLCLLLVPLSLMLWILLSFVSYSQLRLKEMLNCFVVLVKTKVWLFSFPHPSSQTHGILSVNSLGISRCQVKYVYSSYFLLIFQNSTDEFSKLIISSKNFTNLLPLELAATLQCPMSSLTRSTAASALISSSVPPKECVFLRAWVTT